MTPVVLPREVGARDARLAVIWPGAPPQSALEIRGAPRPVSLSGEWTTVPEGFGPPAAVHQRVDVRGLAPASRYRLVLSESGAPVAECSLATLPETLPAAGQAPFTVLLGSCFSVHRDAGGTVGRAFLRLPEPHRPDVALLTGDQVYLDTPISHFLFRPHSPAQLAVEFSSNYAATFAQRSIDGGFGALVMALTVLATGDDHELWNNAPNVAPHLPDTWTPGGRAAWTSLASQLFECYQTDRRLHPLELPPLSVRVADTRFARSSDRSRFMDAATMAELAGWLSGLTGPGLLGLGQPILAPSTGMKGHVTDWTVADYAQYEELVRALLAVNHDVVIVTGDVHFGRVSEVRLPNGRRIVEIVSSPMALVDERAGCSWKAPPPLFPARPIAGAVAAPVRVADFGPVENQFATLALAAEGRTVRLDHTCWRIGRDGSQPQPLGGFSGRLN